jgi:hypothetical protein
MIYGYVSTDGQSVDAQVRQLRAAGAAFERDRTRTGEGRERAKRRGMKFGRLGGK